MCWGGGRGGRKVEVQAGKHRLEAAREVEGEKSTADSCMTREERLRKIQLVVSELDLGLNFPRRLEAGREAEAEVI